MYTGIFSNMLFVKFISTLDIQGKNRNMQKNTATIFGTKVRVNS
jgi:hypothetical protein